MKTLKQFVLMPTLLVALLTVATAAMADADPPSRAVRLKYLSGEVSMQPGGVDDWVAAVLNRPLTSADRVWTDKDSRAELQLGSAALRMNGETSLTLTNVSDAIVQLELDQGTLNLHVRRLFDGETYEIDTPNMAFTILKAGDYRFDVDPNADMSYVTVFHGEGEANGHDRGVKVKSGKQATFTNGTLLEHHIFDAPGSDGFDDWCRVRSDREDHAESYRYVSADVIGAEDLDQYGTWREVGTYGHVWVPAVAPGWAPYHYGHWVWIEPWGWTWVDDAPWGFAPCHYGRWVYAGNFWAWAPGPIAVVRPVYAPALVAWVGGPNFGVGVSFGGGVGVGWFPLGWGEPYVPAYRVSRGYFQNVNVTNTHITNITTVTNNYYVTNNNTTIVQQNITNIRYANRTVAGAVTAVPQRVMVNSESVSRAAVTMNVHEAQSASVGMAAPVAPARTSVLGSNAGMRTAAPPVRAVSRPVVSHMAPPARPVPFEAKQEELTKNPGRPLDSQTESEIRSRVRQVPVAAHPENQPVQAGRPASSPMAKPQTGTAVAAPTPGTAPSVVTAPAHTTPAHAVPRPPQPGMPSQPVAPANADRTSPRQPERGMPRAASPVSTEPTAPHSPAAGTPITSEAPSSPVHTVPRPPGNRNAEAAPAVEQPRSAYPQPRTEPQPKVEPQPRVAQPQPRVEPQPRVTQPSQEAPRPQYQPQPQYQPRPQESRPQTQPESRPEAKPAPKAEPPKHEEAKPEHNEPRSAVSQPAHGTQKTQDHSQRTNSAKENKKTT